MDLPDTDTDAKEWQRRERAADRRRGLLWIVALLVAAGIVTHDFDRVELVREFDWGTEIFVETTSKPVGIPVWTSFDLVERTFAEPGPETMTEERELVIDYRVGAICEDGWRSSATGRGACSWHGGVAQWLTRQRVERYTVEVPVPAPAPPRGYAECRNGRFAANPCSDAEWAASSFDRRDLGITEGSWTAEREAAADAAAREQG